MISLRVTPPSTQEHQSPKRRRSPEFSWAFVKKDDLPPNIHNIIRREDLESFVRSKFKTMDMTTRMAFGLLHDDKGITQLMLGALWGVELLTTLELTKEGEKALAAEPSPRLHWVRIGDKRFLMEVVGEAHARTSYKTGAKVPKVLTRTYVARAGRWTTSRLLKPAHWFTGENIAAADDPVVCEALARRS